MESLEDMPADVVLPQLMYAVLEGVLHSMATSDLAQFSPTAEAKLAEARQIAHALYTRRKPAHEWSSALVGGLETLELEIQRAGSLIAKLPHEQLVRAMLAEDQMRADVAVPPEARAALQQRLNDKTDGKAGSPEPDLREYIFRASSARPHGWNAQSTPQRMYVALQEEHFRLAVALSVDQSA